MLSVHCSPCLRAKQHSGGLLSAGPLSRYWFPILPSCRAPGSELQRPYACALDQVLDVNRWEARFPALPSAARTDGRPLRAAHSHWQPAGALWPPAALSATWCAQFELKIHFRQAAFLEVSEPLMRASLVRLLSSPALSADAPPTSTRR